MNCKCGNTARYINERGELCCAICPLGEGIDSIRLADVAALLAWARKFANLHADHPWQQSLREIIGRGPPPTAFAAPAPLVITNVEQLLNDQTYLSYVPTSADGAIIGAPLAHRRTSGTTPVARATA